MFSEKVREKSLGKIRSMRLLAVFLVPVVVLILGAAASEVLAWGEWGAMEAKIIFETNFTDEDTGIQIFTDGDPWKRVWIIDPNGNLIFSLMAWGNLKNFGLTELFSESNEPNWEEEMSLSEIVALFPPGYYKFIAKSVEGEWLKGWAELSHDLPCAPDEDSLSPSEETVAAEEVVIEWAHVTGSLNINSESCTGRPIKVETYQVIVENLETENQFSIFLEAESGVNQITLPEEFVDDNTTYKWEVLAIAENGNQTIAETWFCTGSPDADCPEPE